MKPARKQVWIGIDVVARAAAEAAASRRTIRTEIEILIEEALSAREIARVEVRP